MAVIEAFVTQESLRPLALPQPGLRRRTAGRGSPDGADAGVAPDTRPATPHARTTWFGIALALAALLTIWFAPSQASGPATASAHVPSEVGAVEELAYPAWTVGVGDTLWTIAETVAPGSDPRVTIEWMRQHNPGALQVLQPGQIVIVPPAGTEIQP